MIILRACEELQEPALAATIGFFDGVHRGHRFLIGELREEAARRGLPAAVITFSRHPRAVLQADYRPSLLNTFEEKLAQLATTGVDYCIVLDFTRALSLLTARSFIHDVLSAQWRIRLLLIGYDHRFGHDRAEGFEQYAGYAQAVGMEVLRATAYSEAEGAVSSSRIRRLLAAGEVERAAELLTYPYRLTGHVVQGHRVGRELGFPTANIRVDDPLKLVPGCGVYIVRVRVAGISRGGMLSIGDRPTLENGTDITIEAHLFDFSGNIYNEPITVDFLRFLRKNIAFDSLEALREQLVHDQETARRWLAQQAIGE